MARAESLVSAAIVLVAGLALVPLLPGGDRSRPDPAPVPAEPTPPPMIEVLAVPSHPVATQVRGRKLQWVLDEMDTAPPATPSPTPTPPSAPR